MPIVNALPNVTRRHAAATTPRINTKPNTSTAKTHKRNTERRSMLTILHLLIFMLLPQAAQPR